MSDMAERAKKVVMTPNEKVMIGIIGGSGMDDPTLFTDRKEVIVETPYGPPSDVMITGTIEGISCCLIGRHGRKHDIMPTNVNYRANLFAMKEAGCTHVIVSTACGSLQEKYKPGDIVVIDQYIDRTTKRAQTFLDGEPNHPVGVLHNEQAHPFNKKVAGLMKETLEDLKICHHTSGTMVTIEGPRFSTKAESLMFKGWGGDLINMTSSTECALASELGLLYGAFAMATDYDAWREGEEVSVSKVLATMAQNAANITSALIAIVPKIAKEDWSKEIAHIHNARFIMGTD
eukprot:m.150718 g.150718  ORF g.150718 m.150718 type:complete len:289 (-) comp30741_c0_seq4:179-1045(-)